MKQKCDSIREWLSAFADGELEPDKVEQVVSHLETCAACRRELDQIEELTRLAKSVEHPRLADDYWDWHRSRVWRGIRERQRAPEPRYRPMFVWPKLAAAAAGFVIVLVVVLAGWRTLLTRPGQEHRVAPVGEAPAGPQAAARPQATTSSSTKQAARYEAEPAVGSARLEAKGRSDELAHAPVAAEPGLKEAEAGYAARGAGTTAGAAATAKPAAAPSRQAGRRTGVAAEEQASEADQRLRVASGKKSRIVSGPVLLESPKLADADVTDTGTVLLSVKTDSAGRVLSAAVRRSSGSARLDSLAVRQMRQSRFKAAVKNNRSVPSSFEYPFRVQKRQTQAQPQEQKRPQEKKKQREEHKSEQRPSEQGQQNQSTRDDKSQRPDSDSRDVPQKERNQRDGHKSQQQPNQPTGDDKSQKPDSGGKSAPLKEKTSK